ncbi:MAG: ABC transporter ATP-binding protein/permease [Clostridia bacterium]|nr:ABC transporter ATP-binding protein/permease [Clostridia bacterium]
MMLKVVNLSKIYNSKKGTEVRALDGVTLQFPEKGMVFLLGKSGSGKSTLLNLCGGLDSPTAGEIIVKGRSSKNFTQSDFDSYRNTFVGFIFPEYNILNEFTVEDNIALALELQGKSKDKTAISALLEQVDLTGFAKRKPNTLSGGQKQRIAIARALVKNPEIIMADEPTGALDSNTGKQVFDTLKKLSQDKLVIVVSHDREFAEQYGDRIIELKDGKVLSDVSKAQQQQTALTENVNAVGEVLCVKNGSSLTDADFEQIKAFLKKSSADTIIASGEKDVEAFKKASRINASGEKEVFADTDESRFPKKEYTKEDGRFIRSKLPARHAMKIGLSGLKSKPFRLFMTLLLCTISFVMFGLLSTLNFYDSEKTFRETLTLSAPEFLRADKTYQATVTWYSFGEKEHSYESYYTARFSDEEIAHYKELTGDRIFGAITSYVSMNVRNTSPYWIPRIGTIGSLPEGHPLQSRITGELPDQSNEIVLSTYLADLAVACQLYDSEGSAIEISRPQDLIGKKITLDGTVYTVVGLFDCGAVDSKYDTLKDASERNDRLQMELEQYLADGLFQSAFVNADQIKTLAKRYSDYGIKSYQYRVVSCDLISSGEEAEFPEWGGTYYLSPSEVNADWTYYPLADKTSPSDNEVIITSAMYYQALSEQISRQIQALQEQERYDEAEQLYPLTEACSALAYGRKWVDSGDGKGEEVTLTEAELDACRKQIAAYEASNAKPITVSIKLFSQSSQSVVGDAKNYTVIGHYDIGVEYQETLILSEGQVNALWDEQKTQTEYYEEMTTEYVAPANAVYDVLFLPYDQSEAQKDLYWDLYSVEEYGADKSRVTLVGSFVNDLRFADEIVKTLSTVFLYVGLVLLVFAVLLFSNFIATSISQKKRDIGILRAVGARSFDVFKIFFSESFFIAALCSVFALGGCFVACHFINKALATTLGASLVVFGIPSVAILLGVALLTAVVSTFLPVYNAAKKKPVDSIRAL